MTYRFQKLAIIAGVLSVNLLLFTTPAVAKICKNEVVFASSSCGHTTKADAQWNAIAEWHKKVKALYGVDWAGIAPMANKQEGCYSYSQLWYCALWGRPCLSGGSNIKKKPSRGFYNQK